MTISRRSFSGWILLLTPLLGGGGQANTCFAPGPGCKDPYRREAVQIWYSLEGEDSGRDLITQLEKADEARIEAAGRRISEEFALSDDAGLRMARVIRDFQMNTTHRTEADLADFGARLYGVSPHALLSAVAQAQQGEPDSLNRLIDETAARFQTTPQNLRHVIQVLHGEISYLGDSPGSGRYESPPTQPCT